MKRRTTISLICIALLLLVSAVSAGEPGSAADSGATLRASTSAAGKPLARVAGAPDVPVGGEQPSWVGSLVLVFGGLLGGVWLLAGMLADPARRSAIHGPAPSRPSCPRSRAAESGTRPRRPIGSDYREEQRSPRRELNARPADYKSAAMPLSHWGAGEVLGPCRQNPSGRDGASPVRASPGRTFPDRGRRVLERPHDRPQQVKRRSVQTDRYWADCYRRIGQRMPGGTRRAPPDGDVSAWGRTGDRRSGPGWRRGIAARSRCPALRRPLPTISSAGMPTMRLHGEEDLRRSRRRRGRRGLRVPHPGIEAET